MKEKVVYLDSSAIIKRYVEENGSNIIRENYLKAYSGLLVLAFNIWNIGEVLGVFDRARRDGRINDENYLKIKRRFLLEVKRMLKLNILKLIPLKSEILKESWKIIEKYHIYEADAVQIASSKYLMSSEFLTGDQLLHKIAIEEKLNSKYLE